MPCVTESQKTKSYDFTITFLSFLCNIMCLCVVHVGEFADVPRGQSCWVPLELQLQVVVSCSRGCWGSMCGSSERAAHTLNHWAISSVSVSHFHEPLSGQQIWAWLQMAAWCQLHSPSYLIGGILSCAGSQGPPLTPKHSMSSSTQGGQRSRTQTCGCALLHPFTGSTLGFLSLVFICCLMMD